MDTFGDIRDWVCAEVNDTSTSMRINVERYIHTIYSDQHLGTKYSWNLNVTNYVMVSGASCVTLPANFSRFGRLWNSTYLCEVKPKTFFQMQNYAATSGIVEYFHRMGNTIAHNSAFGSQTVRFEWYPQFASMASNGATPIIPDKMVLALGAKWLALERLEKWQQSERTKAEYLRAKDELKEGDGITLLNFEDSEFYTQEG